MPRSRFRMHGSADVPDAKEVATRTSPPVLSDRPFVKRERAQRDREPSPAGSYVTIRRQRRANDRFFQRRICFCDAAGRLSARDVARLVHPLPWPGSAGRSADADMGPFAGALRIGAFVSWERLDAYLAAISCASPAAEDAMPNAGEVEWIGTFRASVRWTALRDAPRCILRRVRSLAEAARALHPVEAEVEYERRSLLPPPELVPPPTGPFRDPAASPSAVAILPRIPQPHRAAELYIGRGGVAALVPLCPPGVRPGVFMPADAIPGADFVRPSGG